jgi:hypothetical protein
MPGQMIPSIPLLAGYPYRLFGLNFISDRAIPGVPEMGELARENAIHIGFGDAPIGIRAPEYEDDSVQANGEEYLFRFPKVGRIYVRGGERIIVEPVDGADEVVLWQVILGVGASIAGFRRGLVPIHASAVVSGDRCVALAGQSTAGKSTLAALLNRLGYSLHADDLCLADCSGEHVMVGAGVPELRLCQDAASMAGWENIEPFSRALEAAKSVFRWNDLSRASRRLLRIYVLEFAPAGAEPGIYPIIGLGALEALIDCLRLRLPLLLTGPAEKYFAVLTALSRQVAMFRFVRPRDLQQSRYWTEYLAAHFEKESV